MAVPKLIADFESQISSAISIGSTSFTLLSVTDDDGVALPDGKYYFTVDSSSSNKEYFTGTLTSATKTLASVKNVTRQGIEASGAVRAHRVGANIKITDFATYKDYIDQTAVAGVANATTTQQGAVELPTQAETDARTATGGTGAGLAVTPDVLRATKYHDYAADSVGSDAYAITITPAITAYSAGQEFTFKAGTANTGACTLNVSGLGAKTIKKDVSSDLATGDILANQIISVVYDGTNMQLKSVLANNPTTPIVRTYLNAGSPATWTKPTGLKYVKVQVQAGGGGGAGTGATDDEVQSSGGGGGYSEKIIAAGSLGATETVTTGAGGAGGTGNASGSTGGSSSFGTHATATGGGGGVVDGSGGAGGVGSSGDLNLEGGGGGSFGQLSTTQVTGVMGGSSHLGGGAYGLKSNGSNGITGGLYGGGGSGATQSGSGPAYNGGTGGAGIVVVTEYY